MGGPTIPQPHDVVAASFRQVTTSRRPNAAPTQNWMNWKVGTVPRETGEKTMLRRCSPQHHPRAQDSSLCDPRNEAKANTIISPRNNSQHIGTIMGDFQDARGEAVIGVRRDSPSAAALSRAQQTPSCSDERQPG